MPNEEKTKPGRTLRKRAQRAAELTAQQQQERFEPEAAEEAKKPKERRVVATPKGKTRQGEKQQPAKSKPKTTQRKATPEQTAQARQRDAQARKESAQSGGEALKALFRRFRIPVLVIVALVVLMASVYPMARTYYSSLRQEQRLEAQLEALEKRNDEIASQNEKLDTEEGIENQARKDLGYVQEGEHGTVITNAGDGADTSAELPAQVESDQITAPSTWYYDILDTIFMVES